MKDKIIAILKEFPYSIKEEALKEIAIRIDSLYKSELIKEYGRGHNDANTHPTPETNEGEIEALWNDWSLDGTVMGESSFKAAIKELNK